LKTLAILILGLFRAGPLLPLCYHLLFARLVPRRRQRPVDHRGGILLHPRGKLPQCGALRAAFHAAISLFHMHDWVWKTHEQSLRASFTYTVGAKKTVAVHDAASFATSLEQQHPDFGRIRSIANAAKHLELKDIRPVQNAASHAANTAVHVPGAGQGGYGVGAGYGTPGLSYAGPPCVMLEGPPGKEMEFYDIAKTVCDMWTTLRVKHGWW
jgi:hypothetical protein